MFALAGADCSAEVGSSAAGEPDDRAHIQRRVASYTRDYLGGAGEAACSAYTPGFRQSAERRARSSDWSSCAEILGTLDPSCPTLLPAEKRREALARISDPRLVRVELEGERASAGFDPRTAGRLAQRVALEKVEGTWRISALGGQGSGRPAEHPMIDRLRAQTGQTATEYLGVVLVAAAIVSVILSSSSGIAEAITGQVERAFCTLAAGEPRPQAPPTRTAIGHRGRVRETSTATASPTRPRPRAGPIRTRPTWTATG